MSILNEFKEKEKDYILLSNLIRLLSKKTNSPISEVKTYLIAHHVHEHIPIYDKNIYQEFVQDNSEDFFGGNTTLFEALTYDETDSYQYIRYGEIYLKKDDLIQFEPVAKYNLFASENTSEYYEQFNQCKDIKENFDSLSILEASLLWCGVPHEQVEFEKEQCSPKGDNNGLNRNTFIHPYISCVEPRCLVLHEAFENDILPMGRDGDVSELREVCGHIAHHRRTIKISDLKSFISEYHPNDKPKTLFPVSDNKNTETPHDTTALLQEKIQLEERLENAKKHFLQQQTKITQLEEQLAQAQQVTPASDEELTGLSKVNADKDRAKNTVRAFADYLWKMDKDKKIRTGDMTQQVKSFMLAVGNDVLPENDDSLKEWFADVRPDYAKKGGRTSKNAPTEISLTMKL